MSTRYVDPMFHKLSKEEIILVYGDRQMRVSCASHNKQFGQENCAFFTVKCRTHRDKSNTHGTERTVVVHNGAQLYCDCPETNGGYRLRYR